MKKSSLTLLSILALSSPVFGQLASDLVIPISGGKGTHQFTQSGTISDFTLCTHELCRVDDRGYLQVDFVAAGSAAGILAKASKVDSDQYLVFYPAGQEGNPDKRRILRKRYLVLLAEGADLEAIKARCGMKSIKLIREGSRIAICEEVSAGRVLRQLSNVLNDPQIVSAEPVFAKRRDTREIPTDPFYGANNLAQTNGNYQWYLNNVGVNGGVPGIDINFEAALDLGVTGAGITVAVVDDGVAIDHDDLAANATGPHFNFFATDIFGATAADNPATLDIGATHGTAVAGLIAAAYNNDEGISGVAPAATLSGIRLLPGSDGGDRFIDDVDEAAALLFALDQVHIYNNSWGPINSTLNLQAPGPLVLDAFETGALTGRVVDNVARGAIYVWAGGNGGEIFARSDYDGYANSKYTIAVGALADSGRKSGFSEEGSNLVVVAPSNGGSQGILTTSFGLDTDDDDDLIRTSEYRSDFGGTSAAAPIVSGVVALMLEENPDLNWREVQDVLIRSAVQVDANDGDWIQNAAGLNFNHKYGAGLVDAEAAVKRSLDGDPNASPPVPAWTTLGPVSSQSLTRIFTGRASDLPNDSGIVPDNDGSSLLVSYDMSQDIDGNALPNMRVEHVELRARVITQSRTDLEIVLISPNGTQSILHAVDQDNTEESITNWTFMTVRNWGEGSAGNWIVRVTDRITGNPAVFQNATLKINGVADPNAPVFQIPILTSAAVITINQGDQFDYVIQSEGAVSATVTDLPQGASFDSNTNTISGIVSEAGLYVVPIVLTDASGVTGNFNLRIVVRPTAVALGDAVGLDGIPAVFGGDVPWDFELVDTNSVVAGGNGSAARSGVGLLDGQTSSFGFDDLGQGVLMFDWKTSSEPGADRLWFNRGGEIPQVWDAFIDGSREWATSAVILPESSNDVRWIYSKDANKDPFPNSAGEDRGLIDNVQLIAMDEYMLDLVDAGPIEGFVPEFDGRTIFYPKVVSTSEGSDGLVLASPAIGNGQETYMTTWVNGPGTFTAAVDVYAHESDAFELFVGSLLVARFPGNVSIGTEVNSVVISEAIPAGPHRIRLSYHKDFSIEAFGLVDGLPFEGILLDDISFIPDVSFAAFLRDVNPADDGDGYSLFEEYAFGGDFNVAGVPTYFPVLVTSGGETYFEYGDNTALNIEYTLQQSTNLVDWVNVDLPAPDRIEGDVEVFRIPVIIEPGSPALYYRVLFKEEF